MLKKNYSVSGTYNLNSQEGNYIVSGIEIL